MQEEKLTTQKEEWQTPSLQEISLKETKSGGWGASENSPSGFTPGGGGYTTS